MADDIEFYRYWILMLADDYGFNVGNLYMEFISGCLFYGSYTSNLLKYVCRYDQISSYL